MIDIRTTLGRMDIYLIDQIMRGRIVPRMSVLDAGCGTGRNLLYFLRSGYDVFAADGDGDAIAAVRHLAQEHAPHLSLENFRNEFVDAMTFPDALADVVVSNAVLHFARDDDHFDACCTATLRVLKPGGLFFCRLASTVGVAPPPRRIDGRRFVQPDGDTRYLVDEALLLGLTEQMGTLADPLKTTVVHGRRSMTTWSSASAISPAQRGRLCYNRGPIPNPAGGKET